MLSKILKKSDCASCKFCCAFRKVSQWETPIFKSNIVEKLIDKYPTSKFKAVGTNSMTIDLSSCYGNDESFEAKCFFLSENGCILPKEDKPFDCSIWPLRVMRLNNDILLTLTPTCKKINEYDFEEVKKFVLDEGLHIKIFDYASENPDIIKEYNEKYLIVCKK